MADRRRNKQRKLAEQVKPSKEEYAIAKFLRFKIKAYDAKLHGAEVKYFIASEAVDALLSSKWAKGLGQGGILLTTRASCVSQLNNLLLKGCLFHRAEKVERRKHETKSEGKSKKSKDAEGGDKTGKAKGKDGNVSEGPKKSPKESSKEKDSKSAKPDAENKPGASKDESSSKSPEKSKKDDDKKKKQRRVRLQMHEHQAFKDGEEYYVWIYDPVSWKTFIIGLLLLLGVIAVCLFPLWPPEVRIGISYLSWIAIGLLGVIFALFVVRLLVFVIVWGVSFGEHYFWLLPNLSEDVGFWESFVPLYDHKLASDEAAKKDESSRSKDGEETNANETEGNKVEGEEASAADKEHQAGEEEMPDDKENAPATGAGDRAGNNEEEEEAEDSDQGGTGSEADNNDSDDEQQTRRRRRPAAAQPGTGLDIDVNLDNGFEMLDPENDVSDGSDLLGDSDDDKKDQ